MKFSIVPEIISQKKIIFLNEKDIKVTLCESSPFKYFPPFELPFVVIDSFAKKTSAPEEIIRIELDELKKLGFMLTAIKARRHAWFRGQKVIYRLESIYNASPGSKKLNYLPDYHSIQKDLRNNQIRLLGPNAGFPRRGNGGPWIEFKIR